MPDPDDEMITVSMTRRQGRVWAESSRDMLRWAAGAKRTIRSLWIIIGVLTGGHLLATIGSTTPGITWVALAFFLWVVTRG
jgi:hypothetical protein